MQNQWKANTILKAKLNKQTLSLAFKGDDGPNSINLLSRDSCQFAKYVPIKLLVEYCTSYSKELLPTLAS